MKVVVTGVSSFVGCHLAQHFAKRGDHVIGTVSRSRDAYDGIQAQRLAVIERHAKLRRLDLREVNGFAPLIEAIRPELWIHHAGLATGYASPHYDREAADAVNVWPLNALYPALAKTGCSVIVTGSSMEYGPSQTADREDEVSAAPNTPYGRSKLAETLRAGELAEKHGVKTRVARLYIPFGAWDNPTKLLPSVVAKLRAGTPIDLSPCTQRRDFIGISDVCVGYERLIRDFTRKTFDIFNIASGKGAVLRDVLTTLADRLGVARELLRFGALAMRPGETEASFASTGKAEQWLSWSPRPLDIALDHDLLAETA